MVRWFRSNPVTAGKQRTGMISATQEQAIIPTGFEKRPRFQGPIPRTSIHSKWVHAFAVMYIRLPGLNLSPATTSFRKTGNVKAIYCAMAPILKTAPIAIGPANIRRPNKAPMVVTNQTATTGVLVLWWTFFNHRLPGRAPSRE